MEWGKHPVIGIRFKVCWTFPPSHLFMIPMTLFLAISFTWACNIFRLFQGQALMQQWDQKVAKDCQDFQVPKGSVDSLAGQAHLACQDLQVGGQALNEVVCSKVWLGIWWAVTPVCALYMHREEHNDSNHTAYIWGFFLINNSFTSPVFCLFCGFFF